MNWRAILPMIRKGLERLFFGAARFDEIETSRAHALIASGMVRASQILSARFDRAAGDEAKALIDARDAVLDEVIDRFGDLGREVLRKNGITPTESSS